MLSDKPVVGDDDGVAILLCEEAADIGMGSVVGKAFQCLVTANQTAAVAKDQNGASVIGLARAGRIVYIELLAIVRPVRELLAFGRLDSCGIRFQ